MEARQTVPISNAEIAAVFGDIAALLRLRKDNIFKIRAYEKAARVIAGLPEAVTDLFTQERLGEISGAGEAITKKIIELVTTGRLEYYERLKAENPERISPAPRGSNDA